MLSGPVIDEAQALKTLETGLARHSTAPPLARARAYMYRAELAVRLNQPELAHASLQAITALALTDADQAAIADELAHVTELVQQA